MNSGAWTLESALPIIKEMAAKAEEQGFSTNFRGSVLLKGHGDDLDLYFVVEEPMTTKQHARAFLADIAKNIPEVQSCRLRPDTTATIWLRDGRRIDAQFIDFTPLSEKN